MVPHRNHIDTTVVSRPLQSPFQTGVDMKRALVACSPILFSFALVGCLSLEDPALGESERDPGLGEISQEAGTFPPVTSFSAAGPFATTRQAEVTGGKLPA